jgi:lysophospholipase L1-like esterase
MSARGRLLSGLVTIVIALAGFVTVGALPAGAAPSAVQYVALGDSYAAGTAAGSFPNCQQSTDGYPALLDSEQSIHLRANATCSGATTSSVTITQLPALKPGTKLVTLTVGAANLDLSGLLTACTQASASCEGEIIERLALLQDLGSDLADLYAEVAEAAPHARIVVTGYPHLFEPINPLYAKINAAIDQLNTTIQQSVAAATRTTGADIVYVDVAGKNAPLPRFAGHGIGSAVPFINELPSAEAFHPNADGYLAYEAAISAVLPSKWLDGQTQLV